MTAIVQTWGYRKGESRIFDLPADKPVLPKGWYDSPAKIPPGGDPADEGGEGRATDAHPTPGSSPPLPSAEAQEIEELRRLLEEERASASGLTKRIAELEAQIAGMPEAELPPENPDPSPDPDLPMPKVIAEAEEIGTRRGKRR